MTEVPKASLGQPNGVSDAQINPAQPTTPEPRKTWVWWVVLGAVLIGLTTFIYWLFTMPPKTQSSIRTYFTYETAEIDELKALSSASTITIADIQKWEDRAYNLVESHNSIDVDASKIYAYLSIAQMDAAALSYKVHKDFVGNIDLISKEVLCEFYPDSCDSLTTTNDDTYSKKLSDIVISKIKTRIEADTAQTQPMALKNGAQYWQGPPPQVGLSAPSFEPWFVTAADQFRVAPPPAADSQQRKDELVVVKNMLANATNEQKAIVVKWAGGPGTRTPPGIWMTLAADYMQQSDVPLGTYLEVRALLAAAMADAVITVFDSKYYYQYKRPNMFDTSIITIMPTPNHPSYPAGHATISWAAATVLGHYFPNNQQEWQRLATEASDSRTIGGIHFPMDNVAGTTLGVNVGNQALKKWQE